MDYKVGRVYDIPEDLVHFASGAILPSLFNLTVGRCAVNTDMNHGYMKRMRICLKNMQCFYLSLFPGHFSRFCIQFQFVRNPLPAILEEFVPLILLVISSWTSFFIDHSVVPARVFIPTTLFLAIGRIHTVHNQATAESIYQFTCFAFTFGCFIEFALVHYLATRSKYVHKAISNVKMLKKNVQLQTFPGGTTDSCQCQDNTDETGPSNYRLIEDDVNHCSGEGTCGRIEGSEGQDSDEPMTVELKLKINRRNAEQELEGGDDSGDDDGSVLLQWHLRSVEEGRQDGKRGKVGRNANRSSSAHKIDIGARVVFPVAFLLVNLVFWIVYLKQSPY